MRNSCKNSYIQKRSRLILLILCPLIVLINVKVNAQQTSGTDLRDQYKLDIKKTSGEISIDGEIDEVAWESADIATSFWEKFPQDNIPARRKTEVRITYDDRFLYISAVCYDTSFYIVQTLKRDSRFFEGDGFGIVLDPINRRTNAFLFGVSPMNVQSEDLLSPTTFGELNFSWDNKWFSETSRHQDKWIVEIAIPFKTLRYDADNLEWGINFFRSDLKENKIYSWTKMPVNFEPYDIGYTGSLLWDATPPKAGSNISIIPYMSGSVYHDNEADTAFTDTNFDAGFDAKIALSSSMNLDLTVNPDFSQIDVDVQQTNLTRFSLRYPERRPFFLENYDLFADFGSPPARPIFTRRIGLDERAQPIPILYGARLSGNLGEKSRIGLLNLQTLANENEVGQNYSIVTYNQSVFARSVIKGYATNRQAFVDNEGFDPSNFGRNAGLEFNYRNLSGTWNPWAAIHISNKSGVGAATFRNVAVNYEGRNFSFLVDYIGIDTDYYADMGFIPRLLNYDAEKDSIIRLGFEHLFTNLGYTIRPLGSKINAHDFGARNLVIVNPDGSLNERNTSLDYSIRFQNTSEFNVQIENTDTRLMFSTGFTDGEPLPPGTYRYTRGQVGFSSDGRKSFAWEAEIQGGSFYNGTLNSYITGLTYRAQPWGNFSITFEQNDLQFPDPYGSESIFLINNRTEINFSNKIFWTTFLQYNTQINNFNINSRLQWRYKPMSDLFLVYTDNYYSNPLLKNKNRGIVFKLNYWLTL